MTRRKCGTCNAAAIDIANLQRQIVVLQRREAARQALTVAPRQATVMLDVAAELLADLYQHRGEPSAPRYDVEHRLDSGTHTVPTSTVPRAVQREAADPWDRAVLALRRFVHALQVEAGVPWDERVPIPPPRQRVKVRSWSKDRGLDDEGAA